MTVVPDSVTTANKPLVLIVEDEAALMTMLRYNLEKQGFRVEEAGDGEEALTRINELKPDMVLLDWMLPHLSGIEVCRQLRRRPATRELPVIMITARSEDQDAVRGLNTGADDYVTKPFSTEALVARMRALMRRSNTVPAKGELRFHDIVLDLAAHRISRNGRQLHLGGRPFYLRLWALLTGLLPLRLYLFQGGVLIFGDADEAAARDAEVRGQRLKGRTGWSARGDCPQQQTWPQCSSKA